MDALQSKRMTGVRLVRSVIKDEEHRKVVQEVEDEE